MSNEEVEEGTKLLSKNQEMNEKLFGYWACEKDPWKVIACLGNDFKLILYYFDKGHLIMSYAERKLVYHGPHPSFRQAMEFPIDVEISVSSEHGQLVSEDRIEWNNGEVWVKCVDVEASLTVEGHLMTNVEKALFYHEGFLACAKLVLEKRHLLFSISSDFSAATIDLIWSFTYFISQCGTFKPDYSSFENRKSWRFQINKSMTDVAGFSSHIFLRLHYASSRQPSFGGIAALFGDSESDEEVEECEAVVKDPFNWGDENVGCVEDVVLTGYQRSRYIKLSWFSGKPTSNDKAYKYPDLNRIHFTDSIKVDVLGLKHFFYGPIWPSKSVR